MTEPGIPASPPATSAGAMLRAARERQGVHIAVLAAAIKVSPRKLDALEADRYDELPDATFTRALAQTVCRALKLDPQPVLALLPPAAPAPLETVADGLNTPFRDRGGSMPLSTLLPRAPLIWAALALLVAAALVLYWPLRRAPAEAQPAAQPALPPVLPSVTDAPGADSPASGPAVTASSATPAVVQPPVVSPLPAAPAPGGGAVATSPATAAATAASVPAADLASRPPTLPPALPPKAFGAAIVVSEPVWLEVVDAAGQVVFQRTIQPGESLSFDQKPPLKLKIGNAAAARLSFRGEAVDLTPHTRSNVARVELK